MRLSEVLSGAATAGVYRVPAGTALATIERVAARSGWRVAPVAQPEAADKRSTLSVFKDALGFPEWFGGNLDAFADSLGDVASEPGTLVVWRGAERLAASDPDAYRAMLTILRERSSARGAARLVTLLVAT